MTKLFQSLTAAPIVVTPYFAAALMLLLLLLGANVSRLRLGQKVFLGDGGNPAVLHASRAHMNAVEHGLPVVLLMLIYELQGGGSVVLWVVGGAFLAARTAHAAGFLMKSSRLTVPGATVTYLVELALAVLVFTRALATR